VLAYAARIIKFPLLGLSEFTWAFLVTTCFLIIVLVPVIMNYQYIYFSDEGSLITFRYYSTGFFPGNKNSVEIEKKSFSGFTFDKQLFGLVQNIILYQKLKEGIAKYPPINISALTQKDKESILESLASYTPQDGKKGRK
jgi:hypothetical protein